MPSMKRIPNTSVFNVNVGCKFKCTVQKGDIRDNPIGEGGTAEKKLVKTCKEIDVIKGKHNIVCSTRERNFYLITETTWYF